MKTEDIYINVMYASEHIKQENYYLNWSENMITLIKSFVSAYPNLNVKSKVVVMNNVSAMGKLHSGKSLTIIILSEDLLKFEKLLTDFHSLIAPIVISEIDLDNNYIEEFAKQNVHYLTNFNRKFLNEGYAKEMSRSKGNEPVLNFICNLVDEWMIQLGVLKINYLKKEKILLSTVPPSLFDYRLQIKMYLEKEGYEVTIFTSNISNKENRNELFVNACKENDVVIHFLNEYLKRHQNDESSIFENEIGQLIEYFKILGSKVFHGFCWITPQIELQYDNKLRNTIDFVKKTSAKSQLFHSYQVSIGEFKKLLISRLSFFYERSKVLNDKENSSIMIYDYKDMEKGDYLCSKLSNEYPNLLSYKDYKQKKIIVFDDNKISLFKYILLYFEKVEEEWVASMIKYLVKVVKDPNHEKIKIYCASEYPVLEKMKNYGLQIEHIN